MQRHYSRAMWLAWAAENAQWRIVLTSPRKQMRRAYAANQLFLVGLHRRVRRATP